MKFVYFGSSYFSRIVLDSLVKAGKIPSLAVTVSDKPSGRGLKVRATPVKVLAREKGIEVLAPPSLNDKSFIKRLVSVSSEVFVVVSYGRIIPKNVLDAARIIPVAVHPSLLPLYRGAAPINWVIINGESKTGTSIIKVSEKVDAGDIIAQRPLHISGSDDAVTLSDKLARLSASVLLDTLNSIEKGKYTLTPQDESKATFAPKIKKEDGRILWGKDASSIRNLVRGLLPWPEAFTFHKGKIVKILKVEVYDEFIKRKPSVIVKIDKEGIYVAAGRGIVIIKRVKPEGRKEMDAYAFSCGHNMNPGETFG
ncbi:MAG: methionyl-tRNA formyltransferase [Candidatus Omnitrophica bacterium 4484_171]|nr:MAG: methionyl-tRNA formyltransferase [Candidatus Omnitrophica bacterium 4484_171]